MIMSEVFPFFIVVGNVFFYFIVNSTV